MNRHERIAAFLARHGYAGARAEPLAQDASFRRYLRLAGGPRPAVLMDAPAPEDVRPFLHIADHLAAIGLSAPQIIAADAEAGLVLEEDLGDGLLSTLWPNRAASPAAEDHTGDGPAAEDRAAGPPAGDHADAGPAAEDHAGGGHDERIATAAIDALIALQRAAPPAYLPAWDARAMAQAALGTLLDWWWPAAWGAPAPQPARDDFAAALDAMLQPLQNGPRTFVHRDFFAGNLLWLPHRTGIRRVGILDFQSAALGHPAYDLVSLLQDARRDIPQALAEHMIAHYLAARPDLDPDAFHTAYAACAAQRHLRVACQWVRLAVRDHRPHYLAHGPRTWRLLQAALTHPAAAPLAAAMDRWIPSALRANPQGLAA